MYVFRYNQCNREMTRYDVARRLSRGRGGALARKKMNQSTTGSSISVILHEMPTIM